jgi:CRISPR-associated endoribonuclease Cas6
MRFLITLQVQEPLILPLSYNHLVQASIYSNISPELSKFLHDKGFIYGKRHFKFFTFSRLMGKYQLKHKTIQFNENIHFYVSSPLKKFMNDLANSIMQKGYFKLGNYKLEVVSIKVHDEPVISNKVNIKMLSPVTVYSTLLTPDGRKKTYYYSPFEKEFQKLIDDNLKKKYFIFFHKKLKSDIIIKPLKVRETIIMYKNFLIKGWVGTFRLEGPKKALKLAYDAGLGSKNSQGFGMFEVISR